MAYQVSKLGEILKRLFSRTRPQGRRIKLACSQTTLMLVLNCILGAMLQFRTSEKQDGGLLFMPKPAGPVISSKSNSLATLKTPGFTVVQSHVQDSSSTWESTGPGNMGIGGAGAPLAAIGLYTAISAARHDASRGRVSRECSIASEAMQVQREREQLGVAFGILGLLGGWVAIMCLIQRSIVAIPGLTAGNVLFFPIISSFLIGYSVIVLEEQTNINRASSALIVGVMTWFFIGTGLDLTNSEFQKNVKDALTSTSEVVFYLLGSLTIVEIIDAHKGFDVITKRIVETRARDLMMLTGVLTFVLSAILNNLMVVVVMLAMLKKLVADDSLRLRLGGVVVACSNCGGAWSPIGATTTTMLYLGGQVTMVPLLCNLVVPSFLCLFGILGWQYVRMDATMEFERPPSSKKEEEEPQGQALVFWSGIIGMLSIPVYASITGCPPWCGMILVLGVLGVITSVLHKQDKDRFQLKGALSRVELPDCLFLLGILFAIGGLDKSGALKGFAEQIRNVTDSDALIAIACGFASAIVDNVPLVAATQGMYPLADKAPNANLWNLIAYCAASGGSLLAIGSSAGVAFLGLEPNASFAWYLKNISPGALIGFFIGLLTLLSFQGIGLVLS